MQDLSGIEEEPESSDGFDQMPAFSAYSLLQPPRQRRMQRGRTHRTISGFATWFDTMGFTIVLVVVGISMVSWPSLFSSMSRREHALRLSKLRAGEPEAFFEEKRSLETYPPAPDLLAWRRVLGAGNDRHGPWFAHLRLPSAVAG